MQTALVTCHSSVSAPWQPGQPLVPAPDTISVFRMPLPTEAATVALWETLLQPTERERADRFRFPADRHRFVVGRGLFRLLAGVLSGQNPADVRVDTSPTGKPFLPDSPTVHLNVSHSGAWIVLAVGCVPVGVDVEFMRSDVDVSDLFSSILSPAEQRALVQSPDAQTLFYQFWTRKEALMKATGQGMNDHLTAIPALEGTHRIDAGLLGGAGHWRVYPFAVDRGYPAALALPDGPETVCFYEIDPASFRRWCPAHPNES
ncbi:4'-phosphopantetheinyl transferase family protein [Rudanella lutea]|uniref:4'-phosphopantetheinyl transferase family protein n=1 Tax=Rudanella lutea TaxID=451374 RepID=UPI00037E51B6|nr:4'-phosphopantetheinyl transferase superfamily protein [Rudanella lutea]